MQPRAPGDIISIEAIRQKVNMEERQYTSASTQFETITIPFRSKVWIRPRKIHQFKRGREVFFDWGLDWAESSGTAMIFEEDGVSSVLSLVVPYYMDHHFRRFLCEKMSKGETWQSEELDFEKKLKFYPYSFKMHESKPAEMTDVYLHMAGVGSIGRRVYRSGRIGIIPNELTTYAGLQDFKKLIKDNLSEIWSRIDATKAAKQSAATE